MDRYIEGGKGKRKIWIFGAEKSFPDAWKCGILNLLFQELSNGVWIIQIGQKLADADIQKIKWPLRPSENIAKRRKRRKIEILEIFNLGSPKWS